MRAFALAAASALVVLALPSGAHADSMDPALGRLVLDESCRTAAASGSGDVYDPTSQFRRCQTNDAAFAKLVAQLGTAVAPIPTHPARTAGFGGFRFGVQGAYTTIDNEAHYWKEGTQGPADESTGQSSDRNRNPDSVLQLYSLYLAKGFPFGVELGAGFGYLANTNIVNVGGDVRVALFEGFREHIPGYFPDLGIGSQVRTITGSSEMKITVVSFDAEISKPFHIAGTVTLTPKFGYQFLRIFGDAGQVDVTPNTDALGLCDYEGDNNPATPDRGKPGFDGQPVCSGSSADFNNNVVFERVRLWRHRLHFGAQLRFQMLTFGIHIATDVVDPVDANPEDSETISEQAVDLSQDPSGNTRFPLHRLADDPRTEGNDAVTRQWTTAIEIGAQF
jgi:hypothetical protein